MDYENMSDAELDQQLALLQQNLSNPAPKGGPRSIEEMSDEELDMEIMKLQNQQVYTPGEKEPETIQEMHPDFTAADRFVVNNFANDPTQAQNYLQQRHPNLEISTDANGNFRARRRGSDEPYRVLDPDTDLFSLGTLKDLPQDFTDAAWDVGSGIAETAAATAGAAGGFLAGGGVGAIPGAMLAGGAAGTGLEGARQAIGNMIGVNDGYDTTNLAIAGGVGAASPLLLGTGATVKGLAKMGVTGAAADSAVQAGKGLLSRGGRAIADNVVTPLSGWATGIAPDTVTALSKNLDKFKEIVGSKTGMSDLAQDTAKDFRSKFSTAKKSIWNAYDSVLQQEQKAGTRVSIAPLVDTMDGAIAEARYHAREFPNDETKAELRSLIKMKREMLFEKVAQKTPNGKTYYVRKPIEDVSPKTAERLRRKLSSEAKDYTQKPGTGIQNKYTTGKSFESTEKMRLADEMKGALDQSMDESLGSQAAALRSQWGEIRNLEKGLGKEMRDNRNVYRMLRNSDVESNRVMQEQMQMADDLIGTKLMDSADVAQAVEAFSPSRKSSFSNFGKKAALSQGLGFGGYLLGREADNSNYSGFAGYTIGAGLGGLLGSPAAVRGYIKNAARSRQGMEFVNDIIPAAPLVQTVGREKILDPAGRMFSPWLRVNENQED